MKSSAMKSSAMKTFQRKMANPLNWRKANRILSEFSKDELATLDGASRFIDSVATALQVEMSLGERKQAVTWIIKQGIDPMRKRDRMMLWKQVK